MTVAHECTAELAMGRHFDAALAWSPAIHAAGASIEAWRINAQPRW
jgi:hypothetical protein